jgi:ribose 5-phosphate isomerase B
MAGMKIAIGSDHAGFELKEKIKHYLLAKRFDVDDRGTHSSDSVDYPDYAQAVSEQVAANHADTGILVCGTGIGMAIAANKIHGIRAAHVTSEIEAQMSREHNDANVIAIGGRVLSEPTAMAIIDRWLATGFSGGRHQLRINKISELEKDRAHAVSL